jgi:hypothetical protein
VEKLGEQNAALQSLLEEEKQAKEKTAAMVQSHCGSPRGGRARDDAWALGCWVQMAKLEQLCRILQQQRADLRAQLDAQQGQHDSSPAVAVAASAPAAAPLGEESG